MIEVRLTSTAQDEMAGVATYTEGESPRAALRALHASMRHLESRVHVFKSIVKPPVFREESIYSPRGFVGLKWRLVP